MKYTTCRFYRCKHQDGQDRISTVAGCFIFLKDSIGIDKLYVNSASNLECVIITPTPTTYLV